MKLGIVGLGKMGFNLALNMKEHGHMVVAFNRSPDKRQQVREHGITAVESLPKLVAALDHPRVVWLMVTAGAAVDEVIKELSPLMESGDIMVDAGNSNFKETILRCNMLKEKGIILLDAGTSGGTDGARQGICAMVGGDSRGFQVLEPLLQDISVPGGYLHVGPAGSGHFVKMIHNGIEYGMLQAMGEGFELLARGPFEIDLSRLAALWNNGSVIRGWLMELLAKALEKDPKLEQIRGLVHSSGEGQWTAQAALELGVPAPVIATSVFMRYRSQNEDNFSGKVIAALRREFGGHEVEKIR